VIVRAVIVFAAVAAVVWLAAGITASRAQEDLARLVATADAPDRAERARAEELRRRAERRVPGRRPSLLEATLLVRADREAAARLLEEVVAGEPDNAEAWLLLAQATEGTQRSEQARGRVRALAPDVPAP
jgi:predicted Zn-dependent protease